MRYIEFNPLDPPRGPCTLLAGVGERTKASFTSIYYVALGLQPWTQTSRFGNPRDRRRTSSRFSQPGGVPGRRRSVAVEDAVRVHGCASSKRRAPMRNAALLAALLPHIRSPRWAAAKLRRLPRCWLQAVGKSSGNMRAGAMTSSVYTSRYGRWAQRAPSRRQTQTTRAPAPAPAILSSGPHPSILVHASSHACVCARSALRPTRLGPLCSPSLARISCLACRAPDLQTSEPSLDS
ncbi:hypothetical protein L227DRAFT_394455 [Lentinus tigrinus ALCF2SS1-6]|uniref:Uncharacterized protein n=1 Tax=Lentinus tigrinus ALCF2SS1-6 TaxID=1328759 RepID=A0A5C2SIG4_9APHY|nr:hypothetical protein L227DRAFT_394455 [Lentinus tigrinus ALCF2SS1-6]